MRSGIILLFIVLFTYSVSAAPSITGVTPISADGSSATITGTTFGGNPNVNQAAFLGGINGWTANQVPGTYLKSLIPFSTAPGSQWEYVYTYGRDDIITDQELRIPGKNQLMLRSGQLTPSGDYGSTFSLHTDLPQQNFFISFWIKPVIEQVQYAYLDCVSPAKLCAIQSKLFSFAPNSDSGFYGSIRNQAVFMGKYVPDGATHKTEQGYYVEFYTNDGRPASTANVCGVTRTIWPFDYPFVSPTRSLTGLGGYNGQSCDPYDWSFMAKGQDSSVAQNYDPVLGDWTKIQIAVKGGEFDTHDSKLVYQMLFPDGRHEKLLDLEDADLFTATYGDAGDFAYPEWFFFYLYFAENCQIYDGSGNLQCEGFSRGDLKLYLDDFFVQPGSIARVELGDAPVYEDTTHLEIQKPTSWSSGSIGFEVNYGTFTEGQQLWLFVIDDNGVASAGYPVQLGSPPTEPTIYGVTGTMDNGATISINGALLSSGPDENYIAWMGGSNGLLETSTLGTNPGDWDNSPYWDFGYGTFSSGLMPNGNSVSDERAWSGSRSWKAFVGDGAYSSLYSISYGSALQYLHPTSFNGVYYTFWVNYDLLDYQTQDYDPACYGCGPADSGVPGVDCGCGDGRSCNKCGNNGVKWVRIGGDPVPGGASEMNDRQGDIYWALGYDYAGDAVTRTGLTIDAQLGCTVPSYDNTAYTWPYAQVMKGGEENHLSGHWAAYPIGYFQPWDDTNLGLVVSSLNKFHRGFTAGTETIPRPGEWTRVSVWADEGTFDNWDAEFHMTVERPNQQRELNMHIKDFQVHSSCYGRNQGFLDNWNRVVFQLFPDLSSQDSNPTSLAQFYIDDLYIQTNTQARVELCDNANYDLATNCEIQKPINWADTGDSIDLELNYGGSYNPGDPAYLIVINDNGVASAGYPVQLGSPPTEPTLYSVAGSLDDGSLATLNGALLGSHSNLVEWLGGINGPIETMPEGSQLRQVWNGFQNDPAWDAYPGWETGKTTDLTAPSEISSTVSHSGLKSLSNDCVGSALCTVQYRFDLDPAMPNSASEVFTSSWVYLDPTSTEGIWKLLHIQEYMGNEPGHVGYEASFNNTLNSWVQEVLFLFPVDESLHSAGCVFPCAAPLTCGSCGFPQPINSQSVADQWYWGSLDSDGPTTGSIKPAFGQWFRLDWYVKVSNFDTWDGYSWFRITNPDAGTSAIRKWDGIVTHAQDPMYVGSVPFATPWDNVYNIVRWKNQVSNGASGFVYNDDQYVQVGTPARIELCNNANFYSATHCEIQKPVNWGTNSIEFEVNFGSFSSGEGLYLFVITDDLVETNGLFVTLGSSTAPPPLCEDGASRPCDTLQSCPGTQTCSSGVWSSCFDNPGDSCPIVGDYMILQNGLEGYNGQVDDCIKEYSWDDTWENTNYGFCELRADSIFEAFLLYFDLSSVPADKTVSSAILELTEYNSGSAANADVSVSKILSPWSHSAVTWLCAEDLDFNLCADLLDIKWAQASGFSTSDVGPVIDTTLAGNLQKFTFDVTSIVSEWQSNPGSNNGFLLQQTGAPAYVDIAYDTFSIQADRPKLTIVFETLNTTFIYDLDGNSIVDILDLYELILNFGSSTTQGNYVVSRDYNSDDKINIQDLVIHLQHWT